MKRLGASSISLSWFLSRANCASDQICLVSRWAQTFVRYTTWNMRGSEWSALWVAVYSLFCIPGSRRVCPEESSSSSFICCNNDTKKQTCTLNTIEQDADCFSWFLVSFTNLTTYYILITLLLVDKCMLNWWNYCGDILWRKKIKIVDADDKQPCF